MLMMGKWNKQRAKLWAGVLFISMLGGLLVWLVNRSYEPVFFETTHALRVGDAVVQVVIADEDEERVAGLSHVERLEPTQGMLFVFNESAFHTFWMKDMRFDLDFVWIADGVVRDITQGVSSAPTQQHRLIRPAVPVDQVLEIPAGSVAYWGIRIGDEVSLLP